MTTMRLVVIGVCVGGMAAVAFHFSATSHPTGWFAYAPLSDSIDLNRRPAWWPTAIVGPVVGGFVGYSVAKIHSVRQRV
jgi:heme/copper-type cytochrome/quinol oxidase subunit 1